MGARTRVIRRDTSLVKGGAQVADGADLLLPKRALRQRKRTPQRRIYTTYLVLSLILTQQSDLQASTRVGNWQGAQGRTRAQCTDVFLAKVEELRAALLLAACDNRQALLQGQRDVQSVGERASRSLGRISGAVLAVLPAVVRSAAGHRWGDASAQPAVHGLCRRAQCEFVRGCATRSTVSRIVPQRRRPTPTISGREGGGFQRPDELRVLPASSLQRLLGELDLASR